VCQPADGSKVCVGVLGDEASANGQFGLRLASAARSRRAHLDGAEHQK
jgi:hypothetical protein